MWSLRVEGEKNLTGEYKMKSAFMDTSIKTEKLKQPGKAVKCFYCKKKVHIIAECPVLQAKRNTKPVNLVSTQIKPVEAAGLADFATFIMDGYVSLPNDSLEVLAKILRDTAASQSFILMGVLPMGQGPALGTEVPVLGFGKDDSNVSLHRVRVWSEILTGEVPVGVGRAYLVQGVVFMKGNDLSGGKVLAKFLMSCQSLSIHA